MKSESTIYIVEDDDGVRESVTELISSWGAKCESYASAEQFLAVSSGSRPGCLLLDHSLGGINGLSLQDELQKRGNSIPIVVASGHADVQATVQYFENGALTLLEKPYPAEKLYAALESAVDYDAKRMELVKRFRYLRSLEESLTERERIVLEMVVDGRLNKSIARSLNVSQRTVENTRASLFRKFGADTAAELASKAAELRVLSNIVFQADAPKLFRHRRKMISRPHSKISASELSSQN